jgi:hypothetical protein
VKESDWIQISQRKPRISAKTLRKSVDGNYGCQLYVGFVDSFSDPSCTEMTVKRDEILPDDVPEDELFETGDMSAPNRYQLSNYASSQKLAPRKEKKKNKVNVHLSSP